MLSSRLHDIRWQIVETKKLIQSLFCKMTIFASFDCGWNSFMSLNGRMEMAVNCINVTELFYSFYCYIDFGPEITKRNNHEDLNSHSQRLISLALEHSEWASSILIHVNHLVQRTWPTAEKLYERAVCAALWNGNHYKPLTSSLPHPAFKGRYFNHMDKTLGFIRL